MFGAKFVDGDLHVLASLPGGPHRNLDTPPAFLSVNELLYLTGFEDLEKTHNICFLSEIQMHSDSVCAEKVFLQAFPRTAGGRALWHDRVRLVHKLEGSLERDFECFTGHCHGGSLEFNVIVFAELFIQRLEIEERQPGTHKIVRKDFAAEVNVFQVGLPGLSFQELDLQIVSFPEFRIDSRFHWPFPKQSAAKRVDRANKCLVKMGQGVAESFEFRCSGFAFLELNFKTVLKAIA